MGYKVRFALMTTSYNTGSRALTVCVYMYNIHVVLYYASKYFEWFTVVLSKHFLVSAIEISS